MSKAQKKNGFKFAVTCLLVPVYFLLYIYASLMFIITAIPVSFCLLAVRKKDITQSIEQARHIYKIWIKIYLFLVGVRLIIRGKENEILEKTYIITLNHRSFWDILVTTPFFKRPYITIGKESFKYIPFFSWIYTSGAVLVNRRSADSRRKSLIMLKNVLQKKVSVGIYPEGTRNKGEKILYPFHSGAFILAQKTQTDILPALLFNTDRVMPRKQWLFRPCAVYLCILPAISVQEYPSAEALMDKTFQVMQAYLSQHFTASYPERPIHIP